MDYNVDKNCIYLNDCHSCETVSTSSVATHIIGRLSSIHKVACRYVAAFDIQPMGL